MSSSAHSCVSWWDGAVWRRGAAADILGSSKRAQRSLVLYTGLDFTQCTANSAAGSFRMSGMKSLPHSDRLRAAELHLVYNFTLLCHLFSVPTAFHSVSGLKKHALQSEQFPRQRCIARYVRDTFTVSKALYAYTHTDDKPLVLSLRLWHVHIHQAVQQISQRESSFL